jgi:hypothetical protein
MPTLVRCPCGQAMRFRDEDLGKRARCTACSTLLRLPPPLPPVLEDASPGPPVPAVPAPVPAVPAAPGPRYWVMLPEGPSGPHALAEVERLRDACRLADDSAACPEGGSEWVPLTAILEPRIPPPRHQPRPERPGAAPGQQEAAPAGWGAAAGFGVGGLGTLILAACLLAHQGQQRDLARRQMEWRKQQELQRQQQVPKPAAMLPRPPGARACPGCLGTGKAGNLAGGPCPTCAGRGWVPPPDR